MPEKTPVDITVEAFAYRTAVLTDRMQNGGPPDYLCFRRW